MTTHGTQFSVRLRRLITGFVAFALICSHSAGLMAQPLPDIEAPTVEIELVDFADADRSQVFTVQASDDLSLGDVSLHYRRTGQNVFIKVLMDAVGDTGFFSVAIETDPSDLRSFEYYAQALDLTGNRTVKGFAFDPFVRMIGPASAASLATTEPSAPAANAPTNSTTDAATATDLSKPRISTTRKWVYVALGVLAAGTIAAIASGGSSSDGGSSFTDDDTSVPLTIILTDPIQ